MDVNVHHVSTNDRSSLFCLWLTVKVEEKKKREKEKEGEDSCSAQAMILTILNLHHNITLITAFTLNLLT